MHNYGRKENQQATHGQTACGVMNKIGSFELFFTLVTVDTEVLRKPARQFTIGRYKQAVHEVISNRLE